MNTQQQVIQGGFVVIGNVLDFRISLPVELVSDLRIERPNDAQLKTIHELISSTLPGHNSRNDFETRWEPGPAPDSWLPIPLPREEWRYSILTFAGNGLSAHTFLDAARLVEPGLFWLAIAHTSEPFGGGAKMGWSIDSLGAHRRLFYAKPPGDRLPELLDELALDRLRLSYLRFKALDRDAHPGIHRAIELFSLFNRLPLANFLDVLAMFMLIEMLLTHNPGDREVGDSLNHQIGAKVPFVFGRIGVPIDYSCFEDAAPKKIWSRLYDYRSAVAHGDQPDFKNRLRILKNAATAHEFLETVTRRLLRHALDDPDLFEGLKPV
jgi:hypothetical protein